MTSSADPLPVLPQPSWPTDQADELTCKAAGEFFASWMTSPQQLEEQTYLGPGLDVTVRYLRALYGLRDSNEYTDGQLLLWFADTQNKAQTAGGDTYQNFLNTVIQPAVTNCGASVCQSLGWTGNGDLAGIGVFASYYIEAGLATIYMAVLLARRFKLWGSGGDTPGEGEAAAERGGISHRILSAFLETLNDVVTSVFVFSIVIASASLHSILQVRNEDDYSVTTYEIVTAVLVTIFSVCPATLLYSLGGYGKGPRVLLQAVLLALWILMLVVVNLGRATDPSKAALEAGTIGNPFEVYCQIIGTGPLEAMQVFSVASAGLGALWLLYLAVRKFRGSGHDNGRQPWRQPWRVVVALLAWVTMWFFLGLFTALRARSIEVAGASEKSNEWSIGQIIAVTTWAPVLLNFIYILIFGVKEGQGSESEEGAGGNGTNEKRQSGVEGRNEDG